MKFVLCATLAATLVTSAASAADYEAITSTKLTLRSSPSQKGEAIGILPAGTPLSVEVCFHEGEYCLVKGPGIPEKGGFAAGDLLMVDGGGNTVLVAEKARWQSIRDNQAAPEKSLPRDWLVSDVIRTEGDSYMNGAYTTYLNKLIAKATGRRVANTAVGQSEMSAIRDRILAPANKPLLADVTVIWDGSDNGMVLPDYADQLQQAIDALGHDHFIVIPSMHGGLLDKQAAELKKRWPNNLLDWRDVLGNYEGEIPAKYLAHPEDDNAHLNDSAMEPMAAAIAKFIATKGW